MSNQEVKSSSSSSSSENVNESLNQIEEKVVLSEEVDGIQGGKFKRFLAKFIRPYLWYVGYTFLVGYTIAVIVVQSKIQGRTFVTDILPWITVAILMILHKVYDTFRSEIKTFATKCLPSRSKMTPKKIAIVEYILLGIYATIVLILGIVQNVVVVEKDERQLNRLLAFIGIIGTIGYCVLLNPDKKNISWRAFLVGAYMHLIFGALVSMTSAGARFVTFLSHLAETFLSMSTFGQIAVLGDDAILTVPQYALSGEAIWQVVDGCDVGAELCEYVPTISLNQNAYNAGAFNGFTGGTKSVYLFYFANIVAPTVVYFSAFVSGSYYLGMLQPFIRGVASIYTRLAGISDCTAVNAAGSMLLGLTEAPQLIKRFLPHAEDGEICSIMVCGFATVAGSVMGGYIAMGIPAGNIIAASAMNSSLAMGLASLAYPVPKYRFDEEGNKIERMSKENLRDMIYEKRHKNFIDAIADGISSAIMLAFNILFMVSVFTSLIQLASHWVNWMCWLVDVSGPDGQEVTIQLILGYICMPLVACMGVAWDDCQKMGQVLALKVVLNEFVAFNELSKYYAAYHTCGTIGSVLYNSTAGCSNDPYVVYSETSITAIAYACCGFANFGSIGITIGGIMPMLPESKKHVLTKYGLSTMVVGALASIYSGCIIVLIQKPEDMFMN